MAPDPTVGIEPDPARHPPVTPADLAAWEQAAERADQTVLRNAERDHAYCPYCMRCPGLVRMVKQADFLWRCRCGAVQDSRLEVAVPQLLAEVERLREQRDDLRRALQWYVENDETNDGDGENSYFVAGKENARTALARATP